MSEFDSKTPMMKQYFDIKAENPGALVMFRLGDFYEFFGEDAQVAATELDIVLTGRDAGMEERMPMCGVPHHALDQYLSRLIQKGYRVCICEQLEDPKSVKGIVKRGVVRVVTPGTAMDTTHEEESVFIAAILHGEGEHWAFALCEVSTGQLRIAEFSGPDCLGELSGEIIRLAPRELLISENDYLILTEYFPLWAGEEQEKGAVTLLPAHTFSREAGQARLEKQFLWDENKASPLSRHTNSKNPAVQESSSGIATPVWLDYPLAGDCAGAILEYLEHTQKAAPTQICSIEVEQSSTRLVLDPTTFRNLEITRNLRNYEKKGSLLDLMDKTKTAFGARLLRNWLEKPLVDRSAIEARLDAVENLHQDWSRRQKIRKALSELYDIERLMTRVAYLRAVPRELQALRQSFEVLPHIRQVLGEVIGEQGEGASGGELLSIYHEIDELNDLHERLTVALADDIPNNWKEGGFIRAGYHAQADEFRDAAQNGRTWMLELEQREREQTGIKNLKIGYNKVFGYYFDVTKSHLSLVPERFQRKQTLASGERYVTEELINLEGMVLGAEEKMTALELELYQELLAFLTAALSRVQATAAALAKLDTFQSLAELAATGRYCRPRFQAPGSGMIRIKDLRHPVVEQIMDQDRFVPNDLMMDGDTSLYIITGPNMGGKSTYCRSVAIAFLMAQAGSFIPAASAEIPIRDRLFARVGASDDLRGGQSTFMMEMNEVAHILRHATDKSLVILDEVGRGTGTYDGLSVAWAVSRYLADQIRAKTLFATHYLELTNLAENHPEVRNLSLVVEEEGERIVFLHKILPGSANKSYGIHVAKLAGLPDEVILWAMAKLSELETDDSELARNGRSKYLREVDGDEDATSGIHKQIDDSMDESNRDAACSFQSVTANTGKGSVPAGTIQLSFFAVAPTAEPSGMQKEYKVGKGVGSARKDYSATEKEQKVIEDLKKKNFTTMTPLDALNYVYQLQQTLKEDE